jgi:hypothetical protein
MTIKINGATAITNSRRGVFRSVNPGSYTTANRPPGATEGDVIYDSDEKNIFIWNGTEWVGTGGGQVNNLNPAIPPFTSQSGPETIVTNNDGKVEFSLNGTNWSSSLTIPAETIYYCDWTDNILSAAHDSNYEASINVSYPNLSITQDIELELKIDKMPDPFTFDSSTGVNGLITYTSNTISPLNTINAPTAVWGSSNADNSQIAIADGDWEALPTAINTRYVNINERVRVRHTTGSLPSFEYTTTLNIGYGTSADEYETSTFTTETLDVVYDDPTLTPVSNSTISKDDQEFTISAPTGSNINHTGTDWQFASDALFTNILVESLNDSSNLLSYNLTGMSEGQTVYARARFVDASEVTSSYAVSENLNAVTLYYWRFQVRISGGGGGGGKYDGNTSNHGGGGGQGYVVFESLAPTEAATGSIQRNDGGGGVSGSGTTGGSGAFGTNGGNGTYCGGNDAHRSGGGGGGGGVKLNGALLAGVGGGGGQGSKHSNNANQVAGGSGASLPSSSGSKGLTPSGGGNNGGSPSSNPGGGQGGDSNGCRDDGKWSTGGGGGGFGAGTRGGVYGDSQGQGGGGGASWNQNIGYTNGGYKLTHAQSSNVTGSTQRLAKYKAPSTTPTNWTLVSEAGISGTIDLAGF